MQPWNECADAGAKTAAAGRFLGHCQPERVSPPEKGAGWMATSETRMECHSTKQEPEVQVSFGIDFCAQS